MTKLRQIILILGTLLLFPIVDSYGVKNLSEPDETRISVVVIDPGHGGKDWGASIGRTKEKDIVLDIALKLGDQIKTNFPDVQIIYTRSKDVFIPLHQRANIANESKADLFISIHVNSVEQNFVRGVETYVLGHHQSEDNLDVAKKENSVILLEDNYTTRYEGFDPNSHESYIMFEMIQNEYMLQSLNFAQELQDQFRKHANRNDRSVKQGGFLVLRQTSMPSVLIETGFISNSAERNYLISETGKTSMASAIFNAFKSYKEKIEAQSSFNLVAVSDEKAEVDSTLTKVEAEHEESSYNETGETLYAQLSPEIDIEEKITEKKNSLPKPESKKISDQPVAKTTPKRIESQPEVKTSSEPVKTKPETKKESNTVTSRAAKDTPKQKTNTDKEYSIHFAIQIMALDYLRDTTPEKFRGEEGVYYIESKTDAYIRYYSGKFKTFREAQTELRRIKPIFPQAFVVAFENNELISVKKAMGKM